jgi:hypothetical protein
MFSKEAGIGTKDQGQRYGVSDHFETPQYNCSWMAQSGDARYGQGVDDGESTSGPISKSSA